MDSAQTKRIALIVLVSTVSAVAIIGCFLPEARTYAVEVIKGMLTAIPGLAN